MLYPAFGPSFKFAADNSIMTNLGEEGIMIYKEVFDKNREYSRSMFLNNQFIKKLWPTLRKVPEELCFKNGIDSKMVATYCEMTYIIEKTFKLKMPEFWRKRFPAPRK